MDSLDRYLIKEYFLFFFTILVGLIVLYLGIDFLSNFWRHGDSLEKVFQLYWYRIPKVIELFLPISALLSSLLVLGQMSRQNEILALYSSGTSGVRILSTFVAMVAFISGLHFLIAEPLAPMMRRKEILLIQGKDPQSEENLKSFDRTDFWRRNGRLVYNVGRFLPQKNALEKVNTYLFSEDAYLLEKTEAKEAIFADGKWTFYGVKKIVYPKETLFPEYLEYRELAGNISEAPKDFKTFEIVEDTMRLKEIRAAIEKNRALGLDTTAQEIYYHEKIAAVFTPLIFILIGFPFAVQPLKTQTTGKNIAFCFLVMSIYMLSNRLAISVGKSGHIFPMIAAWVPNLFFSGVAVLRLAKRN